MRKFRLLIIQIKHRINFSSVYLPCKSIISHFYKKVNSFVHIILHLRKKTPVAKSILLSTAGVSLVSRQLLEATFASYEALRPPSMTRNCFFFFSFLFFVFSSFQVVRNAHETRRKNFFVVPNVSFSIAFTRP